MNCQKKNENGMCCCTCKFQIEINKHPMNKGNSNGSISDVFGYGCTTLGLMDKDNSVIFYETKHGMCEMYDKK